MKISKVLSSGVFMLMGMGLLSALSASSAQAYEHVYISGGAPLVTAPVYGGYWTSPAPIVTYREPVVVNTYTPYYSPYYRPAYIYGGYYDRPYYYRPGLNVNFGFGFGGHRHWR